MSIPAAITSITVSGTFIGPDGTPAAGAVRFTPSISAATPGAIVPISPLVVSLDSTGAFSVILAATDDPDWAATGFTYTVTEQIRGAQERSYSIAVPAASSGAALDLATVVPVVSVTSVSPYLLVAGGTITGNLAVAGSLTIGDDGVLSRPSPFTLRAENNFQIGSTLQHQGANAGFFDTAAVPRPTVVGSRGGNAALGSLIGGLAALGLLTDSTTA